MLVGNLEDDTKNYHFVIFPKLFKEINFELNKSTFYLILAKLGKDNKDEFNLVIDKIAPLNIKY